MAAKLNISPEPQNQSVLTGSKGLVIAIIIVLVAVIIGVSALIGFKSKDQYQGFIKKVEQQTQELKKENSSTGTSAEIPLGGTLP